MELFAGVDFHGPRDTYTKDAGLVKHTNQVVSIRITDGCCVTLYQFAGYRGRNTKECRRITMLSPEWKNKVLSLKLSRSYGDADLAENVMEDAGELIIV